MTWDKPGSDPLNDVVSYARQLRQTYHEPIGTAANPYVVVVPKWFEQRCIQEGTTPQALYDLTYGNTSFRHGRVEVLDDYREN